MSRKFWLALASAVVLLTAGCGGGSVGGATPSAPESPARSASSSPANVAPSPPTLGATVNTVGTSGCVVTNDGEDDCYLTLRVHPKLLTNEDGSDVLNLSANCEAGDVTKPSVDKRGCRPPHGARIIPLCEVNGERVKDEGSQISERWIGISLTNPAPSPTTGPRSWHTNRSAKPAYRFRDVSVGMVSVIWTEGVPDKLPQCKLKPAA